MSDQRDTDRVPPGDVRALLDLLDGLASRGLASRCTRAEAGAVRVELTAPPAPRDTKAEELDRERLEAELTYGSS